MKRRREYGRFADNPLDSKALKAKQQELDTKGAQIQERMSNLINDKKKLDDAITKIDASGLSDDELESMRNEAIRAADIIEGEISEQEQADKEVQDEMLEHVGRTEEGVREAAHLVEAVSEVKTEATSADTFHAVQEAERKKADFEQIHRDAAQKFQEYERRSQALRSKRLSNR